MNYAIHYEERCGRQLIAARDIKAGEVVFQDTPAAVGADNNPGPICLTCYKRLPGTDVYTWLSGHVTRDTCAVQVWCTGVATAGGPSAARTASRRTGRTRGSAPCCETRVPSNDNPDT